MSNIDEFKKLYNFEFEEIKTGSFKEVSKKYLTLCHLVYFFCFRHFHICTILFRYYVVVILALRVPSNSVSLLHSFTLCLHTSFPICLLKSSCNSYPTSTCLMTNTLGVLESRVFLHYLIKKLTGNL